MALPDLSNSTYVARLRYIQAVHEPVDKRNPDTWVRHFIPVWIRWRTAWMGKKELSRLRSDPFYYYLLARTKYYDEVTVDAIADGIERLLIVGSGGDTRCFRYRDALSRRGVSVLECDQEAAISEKKRLTRRWPQADQIEYMAIDLNDGAWPNIESWLASSNSKTIAIIEGVSPYIDHAAFTEFLRLLSRQLVAGSVVAYDYKIEGVNDDFGRSGRTRRPFRLSSSISEIRVFHEQLGFRLGHMELSTELANRLVPGLHPWNLFIEDGLLRLRVASK